MNILGFNPAHHSSVCLLQDGEIKYFIQEERIGYRQKYKSLPFKSFITLLQNYKIDSIAFGTPSLSYPSDIGDEWPYWAHLYLTYHPYGNVHDFSSSGHHICHVAHSFYNSGFKKCIGIVIDGLGSKFFNKENQYIGQETESIYVCSYPNSFELLYKNFSNSEKINLSQMYETVTMHLGWTKNEAGKTMGLAPYGKFNKNFPKFFVNKNGNPNVFYKNEYEKRNKHYTETFINEKNNPELQLQNNPKEWHYDESKITDLEKDLAWKIQNDTQQIVGDYIEKSIQETGLNQVCCSGGYFLNCVTNYYLQKRFPNIEFYFEPLSNDAGTAIGAAKMVYYNKVKNNKIYPFKSLYLGPKYSKEQLIEGIKKYVFN